MRVLLANKFFYPSAGAETVFFQTRNLLLARGHEIVDFAMEDERNLRSADGPYFAPRRSYDGSGTVARRVRDAAASIYSIQARRAIRQLVVERKPDIAHLHNVYHQLTLSIVDELWNQGVPIVLTVHDYKPVCPAYVLYTDGAPCRRCLHGPVTNCISHRCIKNSRTASAIGALEAALVHRTKSYERISAFVAPSRFAADRLAEGGVGVGRVDVIPNFLELSEHPLEPATEVRDGFLYAGRLEDVKGVRELLEAFAARPDGPRLRIMGRGSLESLVGGYAAKFASIQYLGPGTPDDVRMQLGAVEAVVLPSIWEENCPMILLEARHAGAAVIASDRGGLPEFVTHEEDGLVCRAGDVRELSSAIERLASNPNEARRFGIAGQARARTAHSADTHYDRLIDVYGKASEAAAAAKRAGLRHHRDRDA